MKINKHVHDTLALLLLAMSLVCVDYCRAEEFSIRGLQWGAAAADIKAKEKDAPKSERVQGEITYLVYSDTYAGEKVAVVYRLIHGKLFEVAYNFESGGRKCGELGKKFSEVVTDLTSKNGAPAGGAEGSDACNTNRQWNIGDTTLSANLSTSSGRSDLAVVAHSNQLQKQAEQVTYSSTSAVTVPKR